MLRLTRPFSTMPPSLRQRFDEDGQRSTYSDFSRRYSDSESSEKSYHSHSTAPTDYGSVNTTFVQDRSAGTMLKDYQSPQSHSQEPTYIQDQDARTSVETYASTVPSMTELNEQVVPEYDVPAYCPAAFFSDTLPALPSTPPDFAELFPSTRRLAIRHDDSSADGNMNLSCTTKVEMDYGMTRDMTLFHLRMYDLKKREFSLRRYCRDSGREVCHSVRKYQKSAAEKRPGFQRSLSNALATLKSKSDSKTPTLASLKRSDSGYESIKTAHSTQHLEGRPQSAGNVVRAHAPIPTNTTKLEFSNYAQVDVKRRGTKSSKRYEFEYWGSTFSWKRVARKDDLGKEVSYHLFRANSDQPLAHIIPDRLSPSEQQDEAVKGGWIPPCSLWISDERLCQLKNDVSE